MGIVTVTNTSACVGPAGNCAADVTDSELSAAYVSIRQNTPAYVRPAQTHALPAKAAGDLTASEVSAGLRNLRYHLALIEP